MSVADIIILSIVIILVVVLVYYNLIKKRGSTCSACNLTSCSSSNAQGLKEYFYSQNDFNNEQIQE